jgi:hypothetical protein
LQTEKDKNKMRIKTFLPLLVILAILAVAGVFLVREQPPQRDGASLGTQLLEDLPVNAVAAIEIRGPEGDAVSLGKKQDQWVVKDRYDYPADFAKIADFVRALQQMKVGSRFEVSEATLKRLKLRDPQAKYVPDDEKGILVELKDDVGELLASLVIGNRRNSDQDGGPPRGQYIRLAPEEMVYLVDKVVDSYLRKPEDWLAKLLVDVEGDAVQGVVREGLDEEGFLFRVERRGEGADLELLDPPLGKKIKPFSLDTLASALQTLRLEDVVDPKATLESLGIELQARLEYRTFDGMIYRVFPGRSKTDSERFYLRLEVGYEEPPKEIEETAAEEPETDKDEAKEQEEPQKKTPEEMALEAKELDERLGAWTYEISEWKHGDLMTELEEFFEEPKKDEDEKEKEENHQ